MTTAQLEQYRRVFGKLDRGEREELLQEWYDAGGCEAACPNGCWVEPDGTCEHGEPSWFLLLGMI